MILTGIVLLGIGIVIGVFIASPSKEEKTQSKYIRHKK